MIAVIIIFLMRLSGWFRRILFMLNGMDIFLVTVYADMYMVLSLSCTHGRSSCQYKCETNYYQKVEGWHSIWLAPKSPCLINTADNSRFWNIVNLQKINYILNCWGRMFLRLFNRHIVLVFMGMTCISKIIRSNSMLVRELGHVNYKKLLEG